MGKATQQTSSRRTEARPPSTPPNVARVSGFFTDLYDRAQAERGDRDAQSRIQSRTAPPTPGDVGMGVAQLGAGGEFGRQWPVPGEPSQNDAWGSPQTITGGYAQVFANKPHDAQGRPLGTGNDLTAAEGAPIKPVLGGQVVEIKVYDPQAAAAGRDGTGGYGNTVVVRGDDGLLYRYSHMQAPPSYRVGQRLRANDLVGTVGATGNATGPHLDLEVTDAQGNFLDAAGLIRGDPQVRRLAPRGRPDPGPYANTLGPTPRSQPMSAPAAGGDRPMPEWLAIAQSQMGKPYEWGSKGGRSDFGNPTGFDCSGFVSYVFKNGLGVNLPAYTGSAFPLTQEIPQEEAKAGDLVFWNMNTPDPRKQHIAIYLGGGMIAQSGGSGNGVNVTSVDQLPGAVRNFRRVPQAQQALAESGTGADVSPYVSGAGAQPRYMKAMQTVSNPAGGTAVAQDKSILSKTGPELWSDFQRWLQSQGGAAPTDGVGSVAPFNPGTEPTPGGGLPGASRGEGPAPTLPEGWKSTDVAQRLAPHAQAIRETAARYKVDPAVVAAIMLFESGGRPNQTSPQGAQGVMQVMPATAQGLGFDASRLQDDAYNVEVGTAYLASLVQRHKGDYDNAIAAYINGQGLSNTTAADANGTTGPAYVTKVRQFESAIKSDPEAAKALGASINPAPGSITEGAPTPGSPTQPGQGGRQALETVLREKIAQESRAKTAADAAQRTYDAAIAKIRANTLLNTPGKENDLRAAIKAEDDKLAAATSAYEKARTDRQTVQIELDKVQGQKPGDQVTWQDGRPYRYVLGPDGKYSLEPIDVPGSNLGALDDVKLGREKVGLEKDTWELGVAKGDQAVRSYGLQVELEKAKEDLLELRRKRAIGTATQQDEILAKQAEYKIKQLEAQHWEEDQASDEAAQKATTAGTEATTRKTNIEADALQRKEDNWKKIEAAWQNGASLEDINRMVLQSAQDVNQYVALMAEDRQRQEAAEKQRAALSTEELTRQQRRREDVQQYGTAMESYGRFGVASAPWQTSVLAAAAPIQGVGQAAKGMNIDPNQPWVKGIQDTYNQYDQRQQNTAGAAREAYGKSQGNMFGLPSKGQGPTTAPGTNTAAGASAGAGANYGTSNAPPAEATQPQGSPPAPGTGVPGTGGTGGIAGSDPGAGASYGGTQSSGTQGSGQRTPVQGKEALDLNDPEAAKLAGVEVQPGKAATVYEDGSVEIWDIPSGGGWLPQPTGVYGSGGTGGGGQGSGGPVYSQGRRLARKRRPVPGREAVDMGDGHHAVTHYDDGSKEVWAILGSGPSWEGVGGGGSGYWFDQPPTYGIGHQGGGGASVWQLPPGAQTSMNQGLPPGQTPTAQQVQPQQPLAPQSGVAPIQAPPVAGQPGTPSGRFPTPMAGGYGGPSAGATGQGGGATLPGMLPPGREWTRLAGRGGGEAVPPAPAAPMPPGQPMPPGDPAAGGAAPPPPAPPGGVGEPPPLSYNGGGMYMGGGALTPTGQPLSGYQPPPLPKPTWDVPSLARPTGGGGTGNFSPLHRLMQQSGLMPQRGTR